MLHKILENLIAPAPLCFALGMFCKIVHGGIKIPKEFYYALSIFLLMAIGFTGGYGLANEIVDHGVANVWAPVLCAAATGSAIAIIAFLTCRYIGRLSAADAAGIAAHYAATSAVTYAVGSAFLDAKGATPNQYLATLVPLLDCFGIATALSIGALLCVPTEDSDDEPPRSVAKRLLDAMRQVVTGQSVMLLAGLLLVGFLSTLTMDKADIDDYHNFFYTKGMVFRGALCVFLLEMGLVAGERIGDLATAGPFLILFGILAPLAHGFIGVCIGHFAGMNLGGCALFGTVVASSSYIGAPPAVRLTLPDANPTLSITASLAITFPFNIAIGVPLYYEMAKLVHGAS